MAKIAPFCAVRYNSNVVTLDEVVTPPYDVIDVQAQAALTQKNQYSMINLDLSKNVDAGSMTEERYALAKERFDTWQAEEVLIRDEKPSLYLYYTDYNLGGGRKFTRKGMICLAGLTEFSEGVVKPHEQTFRGVITDRLNLMDKCQANFSSIFSLYQDAEGEVIKLLEQAKPEEHLCSVTDQDGCRHTIWAVSAPETIEKIVEFLKEKNLYIADGHHRYTTSLQLREIIKQRQGEVASDSPYDFTMMYLCGMEDPGLSVLPTHRLVRTPLLTSLAEILDKMQSGFDIDEISGGSREVLLAEVLARMDENKDETMFGFYHPGEDRCFLLTLKDGVMAETCSGKHPEILQKLDVVVLSELVVECVLGLSHDQCEGEKLIDYFSDPDEALDVAVKESASGSGKTPLLFLMNSTPVEQVRKVADASHIMPHKSTYFYPKVLTGLLLNKIVADERIG